MNKIIYDIEVNPKQEKEDLWNYYYQYTKQIKNKKQLVKLCLYCAKYCFEYNNEKTKLLSQKCIELVESWLIDPNSVTKQELLNTANDAADAANDASNDASYAADAAYNAACAAYNDVAYAAVYVAYCLYWCSQIENISMNLPDQYLKILLRTTKQFNMQNLYSNHIEQIVKQDIDKLQLVDYNMLLDISNEHYNIDLSDFCYDNIFSRRNLTELIRREYNE